MKKILALMVAGAVLASTGLAFAGEPTGRFQGAQGSEPQGAELVYFANFGNGTDSHYMPADADNIPQGAVSAATIAAGTMTHYSPADTQALKVGSAVQLGGDYPDSAVVPA